MDETSRSQPPSQELHSWKEIANYLHITIRTAQRWELERGLPIHRLPGGRGHVYATAAELEEWKDARSGITSTNPFSFNETRDVAGGMKLGTSVGLRPGLLLAVLVVLTIAAAIAGYLQFSRPGAPEFWRIERNTLIVSDPKGRELWRHRFTEDLIPGHYDQSKLVGKSKVWFGRLGERSEIQTLFNLNYWKDGANVGDLVCLSKGGEERWRFRPGQAVSSAKDQFANRFRVVKFAVAKLLPRYPEVILVVSYNVPDYPTQIALLSPRGELIRQYWHSGYIGGDFQETECLRIADLTGDGRSEVYLGGVSNAYRQATLVVLDPESMGGASIEKDPDYQLLGFGPGRELGRLLFPRSCLNKMGFQYNGVAELTISGSSLIVEVEENLDRPPAAKVFYELGPDLGLRSFRTSDSFRSVHLQQFHARQLDHQWSSAEGEEMSRITYLLRPPHLTAMPAR